MWHPFSFTQLVPLICAFQTVFAATTYGQEFYIGFLSNVGGSNFSNLSIVVGTTNTSAEFVVESSNGVIHQGTATSNVPVAIDPDYDFQVLSNSYTDRLKGFRIYSTGNKLIYILVINSIAFVNFGTYLAYPCQTFETESVYEYFAISVSSGVGASQFLLVGCNSDTKITVVPTQSVSIPQDPQKQHSSSVNIESGTTSHQFTLHTLQTLLISSEHDLTGTKITSNKPLTVISGHQCATVPPASPGCEPFAVQVPPAFTWGTEFLLSPFAGRQGNHTFRAVTSQGSTTFKLICGVHCEWRKVAIFEIYKQELCYLKTSEPVLLTQLSFGGSIDGMGDPASALISPIDQYIHETEFFSLPTDEFSNQYISVTVSAEHYNPAAILLDGTMINCPWQEIYNSTSTDDITGYGCNTTVSSVSGNHTRHTVTHSEPDGLISVHAYGFRAHPAQGYVYLTGQELKISALIAAKAATETAAMDAHRTSSSMVNILDMETAGTFASPDPGICPYHCVICVNNTLMSRIDRIQATNELTNTTECGCFTPIALTSGLTTIATALLATSIMLVILGCIKHGRANRIHSNRT